MGRAAPSQQDSFICGVIATPHAEYPDNMARLSSLRSVRLAVIFSNMVSFLLEQIPFFGLLIYHDRNKNIFTKWL